MPKQTFFNLEPEKRQAIVEAALQEFAEHPFEQASLTKIVDSCGIAKGSMYQYFSDKLDLYLYIVDLAYEQKKAYVSRAFDSEGDIFAVLSEYYRLSYQFASIIHSCIKWPTSSGTAVHRCSKPSSKRTVESGEGLCQGAGGVHG